MFNLTKNQGKPEAIHCTVGTMCGCPSDWSLVFASEQNEYKKHHLFVATNAGHPAKGGWVGGSQVWQRCVTSSLPPICVCCIWPICNMALADFQWGRGPKCDRGVWHPAHLPCVYSVFGPYGLGRPSVGGEGSQVCWSCVTSRCVTWGGQNWFGGHGHFQGTGLTSLGGQAPRAQSLGDYCPKGYSPKICGNVSNAKHWGPTLFPEIRSIYLVN